MAEEHSSEHKVFMGNLPLDAGTGDVECILRHLQWDDDAISKCHIHLIRDRESDRFKGFGYLSVSSEDQVNELLALNGTDYGGRTLKVDRATARGDGGRGGSRGGRGRDREFNQNSGGNFRGSNYGGGSRNFHDGNRGDQDRRRYQDDEASSNVASSDASERPRLVLKPKTTDPAELEAMKKRDEEETAKRMAKIFNAK